MIHPLMECFWDGQLMACESFNVEGHSVRLKCPACNDTRTFFCIIETETILIPWWKWWRTELWRRLSTQAS